VNTGPQLANLANIAVSVVFCPHVRVYVAIEPKSGM